MQNKQRTFYVCKNCAFESARWLGQCPSCGEWNTFQEDETVIISKKLGSGSFGSKHSKSASNIQKINLASVISNPPKRFSTNISEFDRVLGGGFVPGQTILLSGEPGIGKSTILTSIAKHIKNKVLYVCGEESIDQIKLRVLRMGYKGENLEMLQETDVLNIVTAIESDVEDKPAVIIVDSVQTLYSDEFSGIAGSMTQVRGCALILTTLAKNLGIPMVLVGHVTKEGVAAGPKILEHIVDTVLYLEGDSQHLYRILRTTKNRFGPVSEVGIFEMRETGLEEVPNPSDLFLGQRMQNSPGSAVTVVMEGYRPILFEIQALTVKTAFGYPRRTTSGFNANRLQVLIAILEKRCGLNLSSHDVYLSVAGGFKVNEYAVDLAVCAAIASALKDQPIKEKTAFFGECGLNGEIRKVPHQEKRIKEAKKLGYTNVISSEKTTSISQALSMSLQAGKRASD